ncbi:fatty acid desaturase [Ramlibacter ginsenosidimutans]|uniref:Fatty acid desaturase n=1 Tax=Ramlibacter ginsenosidimutans TaxID=502333 RepID=A0A934WN10_9BURK|nr:fatty acid desaturase [Ramlibacter ginsenosidimutans]MBK6008389.1 fatty acid desaturase [Ramlibacter ginsenosidimutans]
MNRSLARAAVLVAAWFDSQATVSPTSDSRRIEWLRQVPFLAIHAGCLLLPWVGTSRVAVAVCIALYVLRMFAITAFYHRYFSHCAFRAGRPTQFVFALLGASAAQRGPLWWASHHRHHHVHSDQPQDSHSALRHGLAWSHFGWFMARGNFRPRLELVKSFARYPELRFLDRFDALVPLALAVGLYLAGGLQLLVWGFCISTVLVYHATFSINSLAHRIGSRRYATRDASRNNFWLALLTFGEGWHNNHHHYPAAARQGFFWWEIDLTWWGLKLLEKVGIVHDLRPVPLAVRDAGMRKEQA